MDKLFLFYSNTQQTTNPLIARPLSENLLMSCACLWPRHSPSSNYLCRAPGIAAVGIILKIFSYE